MTASGSLSASYFILSFIFGLCRVSSLPAENLEDGVRDNKVLPLFNIVRFQNAPCSAGDLNGTCYTAEECSSRGGTSGGSCANGYGVCCTFSLDCGQMTRENCTYLVQGSPPVGECTYTICKRNNWVCRIRLDFTVFNLANPVMTISGDGGATGDCTTDRFSISGANMASPVICGANNGEHMIVDAADSCNIASFQIGSATGITRSWNIKVTQYNCNDNLSRGGPTGCLQYFSGETGIFRSYAFPESNADAQTPGTPTHLSNQMYTSCFRRAPGKCSICFTPAITGGAIESFGLSISGDATAAKSLTSEDCLVDYLTIPGGVDDVEVDPTAQSVASRICGRKFNVKTNQATQDTICTFSTPFEVSFKTDDFELDGGITATTNEFKINPGGTTGFSLIYFQRDCP